MISDLLTMQDSNYFSPTQAAISVIATIIYIVILIIYLKFGPKRKDVKPFWQRLVLVVALFASLYPATIFLRSSGVLTSYFGNLSQGYLDYGYLYGFSTSVLDRGMNRPFGYSEAKIDTILENDGAYIQTLQTADGTRPNIVVILLESFYDVSECKFLETSEDPIPFIHSLILEIDKFCFL